MNYFSRILAVILLSLSLSACEGAQKIQEETEKHFVQNPHPKQAYRITVKVNDAPGPMKLMDDANVLYYADNCSYVISKIEGVTARPEKWINLKFNLIGKNEYETTIYFDAMKDEDYFGQGICRWKIASFGGSFKASGKPEETSFAFGGFIDELLAKQTETRYFWKNNYPYIKEEDGSIYVDMNGFGYSSFGVNIQNGFSDEQLKNLFNITTNIKEIKQ